ncbi:DUF3906 family protein [Cohnella mopanensis]|uniref:DUF3906 family protein n=1 Tax=Cohnella mopanensis TaxID=2911966 RepID=UPI001EF8F01F|nr:DUF3906 family protein [Cohnella mopanensis]
MFLYKLEVSLADKDVALIVMGDNDEEVMREAEMHLSKYYVVPPEIREIALIEKKRANKGTAYVIE